MFLQNILDNETLHLIAEFSAIVVGSVLMGILLAWLYWSGYKKKLAQLAGELESERHRVMELHNQLNQITASQEQLVAELENEKQKNNSQARLIYDQNNAANKYAAQLQESQSVIDRLEDEIRINNERLAVIGSELKKPKDKGDKTKKLNPVYATRSNYEHVSKLLGRQVTENDLTVISGIGPRTATLLQNSGITTWSDLANTPVDMLRKILTEAGGIYKSQDPDSWPKQAVMASRSEWRKLRVFQETLKTGKRSNGS